MIVLGLTGSIGMGKSTVAAMMNTLGIPVHDSDIAAHRLLEPKSEARLALAAAFPHYQYPQIYEKKTYNINRRELGKIVFSDDEARERLEAIIHPMVRKSQTEFLRASKIKGARIAALDIPLLFETGAEARVDYTITVSAPYFLQRARVLARPDMSEEKFHAILSRQMPDAEKRARSDFVIQTGLGRAHSFSSLKEILESIRQEVYGDSAGDNIADTNPLTMPIQR